MAKPIPESFPPYFQKYINFVADDDLFEAFDAQEETIKQFFVSIPDSKTDYAYSPGKWTLKELLQHVIDTERIFNYRALAIARNEKAPLPGFDESAYAANSNANRREWKDICGELVTVRLSTVMLYQSFDNDMLMREGLANNFIITPMAMGFTTLGHLYHHKSIIESRYLLETPL